MRRLRFETPPDPQLAPFTGWTRRHWEEAFFVLMKAIVDGASPGRARQRIPGPRSRHGQRADELEGFARSMVMAGAWLASSGTGAYRWEGATIDVAGFCSQGILAGTDPRHPEYWGDPGDYGQELVEMASVAWGLWLARALVWERWSEAERAQVARYLLRCTRARYHRNNWLLANVVTTAVLKRLGRPHSQKQIDANLRACEGMYLGDGWYRDGGGERIDYYNAWAFHHDLLLWTLLDGASRPELAAEHLDRARRFVRGFRFFLGGDGAIPYFGRSMTYRFAAVAPVALGQLLGCLDVPAGEARTMVSGLTRFFFEHEILTDSNHLSPGFLRPCADVLESYSCGGSPYWACRTFEILLLGAGDPFWTAKEEPLPIHRQSYAVPAGPAGLLLVGDRRTGHVQLVNQRSHHDDAALAARYTKFAYSSIFSPDLRRVHGSFPCDNVLQFSADGVVYHQRLEMELLHCVPGFAASRYPLSGADPEGVAHTAILVKDDFLVNLHQVDATRALAFREGGYPLGHDEGLPEIASLPDAEAASKDGRITLIRRLDGYTRQLPARPAGDDLQGANVRHRRSVVPALGHETRGAARLYLACLVCARVGDDPAERLAGLVTDYRRSGNAVELTFHDGERAFVQLGDVHEVQVALNGRRFEGAVVMARASADGTAFLVLRDDGALDGEGMALGRVAPVPGAAGNR